jgi:hypothetical protein
LLRRESHDVGGRRCGRERRDADARAVARERSAGLVELRGGGRERRRRRDPDEDELARRGRSHKRAGERCERAESFRPEPGGDNSSRRLGRRNRRRQRLVVAEDRPLEVAQRLPRFEPELGVEHLPALAEDLQRVGLPARPVQRPHELGARPFLEGTLSHERLELGDEVGAPSQREVGLDSLLEREHPELLEASRLDLDERLVREVGQGSPAPQREGGAQRRGAGIRLLPTRLLDEALELVEVELAVPDAQEITRAARLERLTVVAERLPERRDVHLDRLRRGLGRALGPDLLREPVGGNDLVRA